jgi:alkylhydroperoxidase family enzyme
LRTHSVLGARLLTGSRSSGWLHLNRVEYVVDQHVPQLALPAGLTREECAALADWRATSLFDPSERTALVYVDAMTTDVQVPDDVFIALRKHFDEPQIVELSILVGTYNMHTRVMAALAVDPEPA